MKLAFGNEKLVLLLFHIYFALANHIEHSNGRNSRMGFFPVFRRYFLEIPSTPCSFVSDSISDFSHLR